MSSFYAELHLAGSSYRVVRCSYSCYQPTDSRGRASAKVRHNLLQLILDVPSGDVLTSWASAVHKPLAGEVVFYDTARLVPNETIAFTEGECVGYQEHFTSGANGDGAYVCHLQVAAPAFELRSGGPAAAAQVQGIVKEIQQKAAVVTAPVAALAAAGAAPPAVLGEALAGAKAFNVADPSTHFVRPAAPFNWELSQALDKVFPISLNSPIGFAEAVRADLQAIYATKTGRKLIQSLQNSGKKIPIEYRETNGAAFPNFADDPYGERGPDWEPAFFNEAGTAAGSGLAMSVGYNPFQEFASEANESWHKRPPGIGLAHELIHAEQAAYGRMIRGAADNPVTNAGAQPLTVHAYELETVGVPPYDTYAVSENKIRDEWDPAQPRRPRY